MSIFFSWLRPAVQHRRRTNNSRPRLGIEQLEPRRLLTFDFGYALGLGSPGIDVGLGVAADSAGNTTVVGSFSSGSIDLDPGLGSYELPTAGTGGDGFAASYDPQGAFRWGAHFASSARNTATEVAIDGYGNVFVTGTVGGTLEITGSSGAPVTLQASGIESFLAKFDSGGNLLWARTLGEAGANHVAYGMATDAAGNVYATGDLRDGTEGLHQAFIARYDGASGTTAWSELIKIGTGLPMGYTGNTTHASVYGGIAVDAAGNVCIAGTYLGTIDFDPDPTQTHWLTSAGNGNYPDNGDVFVLKLSAAGSFVWAGSLGGNGRDQVEAIGVDGAGNIYVDGYTDANTQNDFDPGPGTLPLAGGDFVVKIDASGNLLWSLGGIEGVTTYPGKGMTVDAAGNVYTTRVFSGTIDADPGPGTFYLTAADGHFDSLVSKLDSAGSFIWAAVIGGPGSDQGRAIALDGQGHIYTTGSFQQTADFDPGAGAYNLTSTPDANGNSTSDVFLLKLIDDGSVAPPPPAPLITITDVTKKEGKSGTTYFTFTVSLSAPSTEGVTVQFSTVNGTATAGEDYIAASGTLTFAPGETVKTITFAVKADKKKESDEQFHLLLSERSMPSSRMGMGSARYSMMIGNASCARQPYIEHRRLPAGRLLAVDKTRIARMGAW